MNKVIMYGSIIVSLGLIIGVTTFKVINNYNEKVLYAESKYIIEQAAYCINLKKCSGDAITLKELYEHGLEKQINSVTKEYYNENSYVEIKDSKYNFVVIN